MYNSQGGWTILHISILYITPANPHPPQIITLDLPGVSSDFARAAFEKYKSPAHPPITLIEGFAIETLPTLVGKQFDLIFIDADKPGYRNYLDIILNLNLLVPGGVILADNILRRGLVADSSDQNPVTQEGPAVIAQAKTLDEFNKKVEKDVRLENIILPVFDGINFVRLKKDLYVPTAEEVSWKR